MKHLLFLPLLSIFILQGNSPFRYNEKSIAARNHLSRVDNGNDAAGLSLQPEPGNEKMSATVFKNQDFCRAELKDFEFDFHYDILSAKVYFTGANFPNTEQGTITSASLKPIKGLMARCVPGSIVIFDNVKVIGSDKRVRTIEGLTIVLR